jgi:DNA-binding winged helix-turn-helix (wHTH) protein
MEEPRHSFGSFIFDARRRVLDRNGEAVAIGSRAMAVLEALLDAKGEAVSKAELMEHVWPGIGVEDSNLTVQIAAVSAPASGMSTSPSSP